MMRSAVGRKKPSQKDSSQQKTITSFVKVSIGRQIARRIIDELVDKAFDAVFPAYRVATTTVQELVTAALESELDIFEISKLNSDNVVRYSFDPAWLIAYPWLKKDDQQSLGTDSKGGCYYSDVKKYGRKLSTSLQIIFGFKPAQIMGMLLSWEKFVSLRFSHFKKTTTKRKPATQKKNKNIKLTKY
jgi:hypothetical protein